jgi:gamma-glutamyl:cysteine ligase YbdK (ATP-grasp superfamily)
MDGWLKLIALACVAVVAATGWWSWRDWKAAAQREAAALLEAEHQAAKTEAEWQGLQVQCEAEVVAWDSGNRAALTGRLGSYAEDRIERCRGIVTMEVE